MSQVTRIMLWDAAKAAEVFLHVSLAWNHAFIQLLSQYGSLNGRDIHLWTPPKKPMFCKRWIWISGIDMFFFCLFVYLFFTYSSLWKVKLSGSPFNSTVINCNFPLTILRHWSRHFTTGNSNHFITGYEGYLLLRDISLPCASSDSVIIREK